MIGVIETITDKFRIFFLVFFYEIYLKLKGASCCSLKSLTKMTKQLIQCNSHSSYRHPIPPGKAFNDSTQLSPKTSILLSPI